VGYLYLFFKITKKKKKERKVRQGKTKREEDTKKREKMKAGREITVTTIKESQKGSLSLLNQN
jgi:hypothetical protein